MKVVINDELHEEIKTIDQLNEVLEDLRIQCLKDKQILQLKVDGKVADRILPGQSEAEIGSVEILVQNPFELVIESMVEGFNYLPRFIDGLRGCLDYFRQGNQSQAMLIFGQCIDGFDWLNHVFAGIQLYILPMQEFEKDRTTYQMQIAGFDGIFKELMKACEDEDYVFMADLIEFELIMQLEQLHTQFRQILNRLVEVE